MLFNHVVSFQDMDSNSSNSCNTSNETYIVPPNCEDISFFYYYNYVEFVAALIITALGFLGNAVTVAVISCWKELHTPTFTMIACLAVSDAYSLLQHFVWHYTFLFNGPYIYYCLDRKMYIIARNLFIFVGRLNAGFQLCLLAFFRYIAVVHPLKFRTYFSPKKVIFTSFIGWVIVVIFSTVITVILTIESQIFDTWKQYLDFRRSISFLNVIIPTLLFITFHCLKMRALRRSPLLNMNTSRKMSVVIFFIILIYVSSSASIALGQLEIQFFGNINTLAFIISCAINPFIYFLASAPMVRLYRRLFPFCSGTMSHEAVTPEIALSQPLILDPL